MKILKTIKVLGLVAMLATSFLFAPKAVAQPGVSVSIQTFYNELSPYGQWVQSPYGSVWLPNAGPDFQPYSTAGHWVVTEFGNTWVSDYPWGWAPFHYGRWYFDNQYGWAWIPGSDWGPAWVSWRTGGGYYGWAPLGPGIDINVNINIPAPYWTFVPQIYITSPNLYSYYVPRPNVINIYQNTTYINNVYRSNNRAYVYGPPRGDIERITRRSVPVYRIDNMDRPGRSVFGNGSVGFYRPNPSSGYGRNDRYDNSSRPNFGGNPGPNRSYNGYNNNNGPVGGYNGNNNNTPGRDYNGGNNGNNNNASGRDYNSNNNGPGRDNNNNNTNSTPNRDYNGSNNTPNRGNYGGNSGSYGNNPAPNPGNTMTPTQPGRGGYSDSRNGNGAPTMSTPQAGNPQRPERSFTPNVQSAPAQQAPGGRPEGGFQPQRMPENRGAQPQSRGQAPAQNDRSGRPESSPGGRGPR